VPATYLGLFVPLLAVALSSRARTWLSRPSTLAVDLGLWGAVTLATFVALWPSMWVSPLNTVARTIEFARETGGQPHEQGSFFLGQSVVDPGPLFYVAAGPLRLSPATTLGLVALGLVAWRMRPALGRDRSLVVLALISYVVGFTAFMSLAPKKFDRYLLPVFPMLDILAGLGLSVALFGKAQAVPWLPTPRASRVALPLAFVVALASWPLLSTFPHYLTYYNPLLGGGHAAVRAVPVGQGEGLVEAARWLNSRPGAENLHVVADSFDVLKATFLGGGETLRDRVSSSTDYVVLYVYQTQIGHSPRVVAEYGGREPEHVVRLNGIEYVRVYRGPRRPAESDRAGGPSINDDGAWSADDRWQLSAAVVSKS
jgi:hypothetical protein